MSDFKRILVTAALPYANGRIHLGHLAGAYLPADIYARYHRSMKHDIVFLCGSDEHGVPITITAEQEGITPQAVVDRYHALNKAAFETFGMSFDNYSRTSLPLHHETAREFFMAMHGTGVLQEHSEKQLYDEQKKMFLPDRYVEGTCPVCKNPDARGDQCEKCGTFLNPTELIDPRSKLSGERPSVRQTSHWYFPLGKYQERLQKFIAERNARDGWKENVLRYCESWFKEGLTDRAVTRDLNWGVKIPLKGYEEKVLYVWYDAVLGYISSTKEWAKRIGDPDRWKKYWLKDDTKYVAFIGKDNVVFHCIVFPAMLMAWNDTGREQYILPENVPANEFLNFEGQKFSKSRGWGVDVDEFLAEYPADSLRYTLTLNLPESRDADFYWKDFQARHNNELADILGNFINRTLVFTYKNFDGKVPGAGTPNDRDRAFVAEIAGTPERAGSLIERYKFRDATLEIMNLARSANKYFNDSQPWKLMREDPVACATTLNLCLQAVRSLAILFEPVIPFSSEKAWRVLNLPGSPSSAGWQSAGTLQLTAGHALGTPEILFAKIEDDSIRKHVDALPAPTATAPAQAPGPESMMTIDDFKKIELRTGIVVAAERVPKSEKLIKVQVNIGSETRQVVAGIGKHYSPEQLIGKQIVVVANLAPAKLMGQESRGMLLAASDEEGNLRIVTPDSEIAPGSRVK